MPSTMNSNHPRLLLLRALPLFCALYLARYCAAQTPVSFLQPPNIGYCSSLATADFNGDGNLDVACAGESVVVWLGDGSGHFRAVAQPLPFPYALLVAGDFNDDGLPDLVIAVPESEYFYTTSQIAFLPGRGNGQFGPVTTISLLDAQSIATVRPVPVAPLSLLVNSAVNINPPFTPELFPGNGDGTFQPPVSIDIVSGQSVTLADVNGDGIQDIVTIGQADQSALIEVALGNADGSYQAALTTTIPESKPFAVADFTHDGIPDIAWSDGTDIVVYRGNGDGTFSAGPVTPAKFGDVLLATDLNGDGIPDLVLADMAVVFNTGSGSFSAARWYETQPANSAVAGTFRHSNPPDLIVGGDYYANEGNGIFRAPTELPACQSCFLGPIGDFNNDGKLDSILLDQQTILYFEGNGKGGFSGSRETQIGSKVVASAAADFTGDGNLDLAISLASQNDSVMILPGNGNGTFGSGTVAYSGKAEVDSIATADFNRDGIADLLIQTSGGAVVRCGLGGGAFTTTAVFTNPLGFANAVVGDFNGDGIPDFVNLFSVFLGNGDGTFRRSFTFPQAVAVVVTGDFNGDGIPDLLTYSYLNVAIYWPGLGDGTFGLPLTVFSGNIAISAVADLNHDGTSDIVAGSGSTTSLTFYLGNSDGTFTTQILDNLPEVNDYPSAGLFSGRPYPDLVYLNATGQLLVLINSTK